MRDTTSWLHAAAASWDHPASREWIVAAHTYDLLALVNSSKKGKKPKPYPSPYANADKNKIGGSSKRRQSDRSVRDKLNKMNPRESDAS